MEFKLELNGQEVDMILAGLSELPFKFSQSLIAKIQEQGKVQIEASAEAKKVIEPEIV